MDREPTQLRAGVSHQQQRVWWKLDLTCNNCHATIVLSSELGQAHPLSTDGKRTKLLRAAQDFCRQPRENPPPEELLPYIHLVFRSNTETGRGAATPRTKHEVIPTPTKYVKCPLCKERIFVC